MSPVCGSGVLMCLSVSPVCGSGVLKMSSAEEQLSPFQRKPVAAQQRVSNGPITLQAALSGVIRLTWLAGRSGVSVRKHPKRDSVAAPDEALFVFVLHPQKKRRAESSTERSGFKQIRLQQEQVQKLCFLHHMTTSEADNLRINCNFWYDC